MYCFHTFLALYLRISKKSTDLVVSDGTNTYTITRPADADEYPIWVVMKPITSDKTITFTTNVGFAASAVVEAAIAAPAAFERAVAQVQRRAAAHGNDLAVAVEVAAEIVVTRAHHRLLVVCFIENSDIAATQCRYA